MVEDSKKNFKFIYDKNQYQIKILTTIKRPMDNQMNRL